MGKKMEEQCAAENPFEGSNHLNEICCQLAKSHEGPHADFLMTKEEGGKPMEMWVLWTQETLQTCTLEGCGEPSPECNPDHCYLFADHPGCHAWAIADERVEPALLEYLRSGPPSPLARPGQAARVLESGPDE